MNNTYTIAIKPEFRNTVVITEIVDFLTPASNVELTGVGKNVLHVEAAEDAIFNIKEKFGEKVHVERVISHHRLDEQLSQ